MAAAAEGITGMRWCPSSRIVWKFENNDGTSFVNFAVEDGALLECAYSETNCATLVQHPDKPWQFDLSAMTQLNTVTGSRRLIRRVRERICLCIVMIDRERHAADSYVAYVNHLRLPAFDVLDFT